ncbi:unnamed protein product [Musa acuminata subsp. malaccensis]|uniref:(wild Malaysian banana) hypothetical protein n=1 Tax=Musa acuminata subsp. malaccensis TaxID=214687 RepID=A0A804IQK0_MUSAM|nr:unnamed protein product [Musa acuminata subsp. malaccensis]
MAKFNVIQKQRRAKGPGTEAGGARGAEHHRQAEGANSTCLHLWQAQAEALQEMAEGAKRSTGEGVGHDGGRRDGGG